MSSAKKVVAKDPNEGLTELDILDPNWRANEIRKRVNQHREERRSELLLEVARKTFLEKRKRGRRAQV